MQVPGAGLAVGGAVALATVKVLKLWSFTSPSLFYTRSASAVPPRSIQRQAKREYRVIFILKTRPPEQPVTPGSDPTPYKKFAKNFSILV